MLWVMLRNTIRKQGIILWLNFTFLNTLVIRQATTKNDIELEVNNGITD